MSGYVVGRTGITRREMMAGSAVAISSLMSARLVKAQGSLKDAQLTLVRNATLRIDYGGYRFLVDPMLGDAGSYPGAPGSAHSEMRNPLVPLPDLAEDLTDADAVIVTHLHPDHWDQAAVARLSKSLPVFSQNDADAAKIREAGFSDVRVLGNDSEFNGVKLTKTGGQHGSDATIAVLGERLGQVCGVVFSHPDFRTLYLAGDTVWNAQVEEALSLHQPEVIVLNAGHALFLGFDPIIMGTTDVLLVHQAAPQAKLIAVHMEALNHCLLSRADLRSFSERNGFSEALLIPADGEMFRV